MFKPSHRNSTAREALPNELDLSTPGANSQGAAASRGDAAISSRASRPPACPCC